MDSRFDAYDLARDAVREAERRSQRERDKPPPAPLAFLDPATLHGLPIPERQWVVPGWLPSAAVTLHYAAGGEGKTLLAQMLMTSAATGMPWLGLPVTHCRAMGLFCEDDADEMHRRQDAICRSYGVELRDLGGMRWSCPVGDDNTLIRFEPDGTPVMTDRFADFVAQARAFAPGLVVLDVAADLFGGNENVRQQVSTFLKFCLGGLARDLGAAVLLNAHPSRAGISSGDMDGGSTGWNGGARSRWSLVTPRDEDGPVDETARVLTKRKANYSTRGDEIRLRFARRRAGARGRAGQRHGGQPGAAELRGGVPGPAGQDGADRAAPRRQPQLRQLCAEAFQPASGPARLHQTRLRGGHEPPVRGRRNPVEHYGKPVRQDRTTSFGRVPAKVRNRGAKVGAKVRRRWGEGVPRRWAKVADFRGRRWAKVGAGERPLTT